MGVENIITFDAHDARVQNATPLHGFETIQPAYQFIKALLKHEEGLDVYKRQDLWQRGRHCIMAFRHF